MSRNLRDIDPVPGLWMGAGFFLAGLFIVLVAADWIHVDPSTIHAPRWVLGICGGMFAVTGLGLFRGRKTMMMDRTARSTSAGFVPVLVFLFLVLPAAVLAQGTSTYVVTANQAGASVSIIDAGSREVVRTLPTEVGPHEAAVSSDGRWVVISNYGDQQVQGSSLLAIDGRTLGIADTISLGDYRRPHGMAFLPGDSLLAVTVERDSAVLVVRFPSGEIKSALPTGQWVSHMLAIHPNGRRIYTANITDATVSEIDVETATLVRTAKVGPVSEAIGITPDGGELWVGSNTEHTITVLDTDDLSTIATLEAPGFPYRIAFTPDGATAVVPQPEAGVVRLFDVATHTPIGSIPLDGEPAGITISRDGELAYVSRNAAGSVAVVSLVDRAVVRTLPAGAAPDGIVVLEGIAGVGN
jgi:DNA-binding beta-propeller fold protein YncE